MSFVCMCAYCVIALAVKNNATKLVSNIFKKTEKETSKLATTYYLMPFELDYFVAIFIWANAKRKNNIIHI